MTALLGVLLMEFGDFTMLRRMLSGITERAECAEHEGRRRVLLGGLRVRTARGYWL